MKLLIINPGGTSTKIAVFEDEEQVLKKNIIHTQEEYLKRFFSRRKRCNGCCAVIKIMLHDPVSAREIQSC